MAQAFSTDWRAVVEARIAGVCYLVVIAGGIFAAVFVREATFVAGNPGATAAAIAENQLLWRAGIAVHLVYLLAAAAVGVILYRLFRPVHGTLALLALVLTISDVALEALLMTGLYVPLALLDEPTILQGLSEEQHHALAYLAVRLFFRGWSFALFLFGGFCIVTGVLIIRSRLVPRLIGLLMMAAGVSYMVNCLAAVLSPSTAQLLSPWIMLPPFVGELSLAVWLAARGVRQRDSVALLKVAAPERFEQRV